MKRQVLCRMMLWKRATTSYYKYIGKLNKLQYSIKYYIAMIPDIYLWIPVAGTVISLFTSFGIGANDVANTLGTSIGSEVLTFRQAIVVASIFEFAGAALMGSRVTDTIRKKIVDQIGRAHV